MACQVPSTVASCKPAHRKGSQVDAPRRPKVHPVWAQRQGGMGKGLVAGCGTYRPSELCVPQVRLLRANGSLAFYGFRGANPPSHL